MKQYLNKPVVIYGPAGCGKTHNGAKLAKAFGKKEVVDDVTVLTPKLGKHQLGLCDGLYYGDAIYVQYSRAMKILKTIKKAKKRAQNEVLERIL